VTKFFNGNPVLGTVGGGADAFAGRTGRKRWADIESLIGRGWDTVVDAIDEIVTTPDVDAPAVEKAQAELDEPAPEPEEDEVEAVSESDETEPEDDEETQDEASDGITEQAEGLVLGSDEDFWAKVGIDPVRMMTSGGTYYTLRCYLDDE